MVQYEPVSHLRSEIHYQGGSLPGGGVVPSEISKL